MDLNMIIEGLIASAQAHLPLTVAAGVLLLLLFYRSPKLGFGLLAVVLLLVGVLVFISHLSSLGVSQKARMVSEQPVTGDRF